MANPKQYQIAVGAGPTFTSIPATIPCHYLKVIEDADRTHALDYQTPDDNFATTFTTKAGDAIERIGNGREGKLGNPPNFAYSGQTASTILKIRSHDNSAITIDVTESASQL